MAEETPHWADRVEQIAPDAWEIRFRCPPSELPYYARELLALGPLAEALAPPSLRDLVRDLAAATVANYADDATL